MTLDDEDALPEQKTVPPAVAEKLHTLILKSGDQALIGAYTGALKHKARKWVGKSTPQSYKENLLVKDETYQALLNRMGDGATLLKNITDSTSRPPLSQTHRINLACIADALPNHIIKTYAGFSPEANALRLGVDLNDVIEFFRDAYLKSVGNPGDKNHMLLFSKNMMMQGWYKGRGQNNVDAEEVRKYREVIGVTRYHAEESRNEPEQEMVGISAADFPLAVEWLAKQVQGHGLARGAPAANQRF